MVIGCICTLVQYFLRGSNTGLAYGFISLSLSLLPFSFAIRLSLFSPSLSPLSSPLSFPFPEKYAHHGVKINTPHYLAKLEFLPSGTSTFTAIVSQLESLSTIYYTIRVSMVYGRGHN